MPSSRLPTEEACSILPQMPPFAAPLCLPTCLPACRSNYVHNFAEFSMRLPARLWVLQQAGAMSNRTTLVVGTPAGKGGGHVGRPGRPVLFAGVGKEAS